MCVLRHEPSTVAGGTFRVKKLNKSAGNLLIFRRTKSTGSFLSLYFSIYKYIYKYRYRKLCSKARIGGSKK